MMETPIAFDFVSHFAIDGMLLHLQRFGNGHINQTFHATYSVPGGTEQFIHQRINRRVFKDIAALMSNVERVTRHLGASSVTLIPARNGATYARDDRDGEYWRTFRFVEDARTVEVVDSLDDAYRAAHAFGAFGKSLGNLPPPALHVTIPAFHDTERRFAALQDATTADRLGRVPEVSAEIAFAQRHERLASALRFLDASDIPVADRAQRHQDQQRAPWERRSRSRHRSRHGNAWLHAS